MDEMNADEEIRTGMDRMNRIRVEACPQVVGEHPLADNRAAICVHLVHLQLIGSSATDQQSERGDLPGSRMMVWLGP